MENSMLSISLDQARKIAEDAARMNLSDFLLDSPDKILRDEYLEAEYCWMFFRCRKIVVPPEASLRGDWAYAVSKTGLVRDVPDLSDDRERLHAYLEKMSDYFRRGK